MSKPMITRFAGVTAMYLTLLWGHVVFVSPAAFASFLLVVVVAIAVVAGIATSRLPAGRNAGIFTAIRPGLNSTSLMEATQQLDQLQAELSSLEDQYATEVSGSTSDYWQSDIGNTK